MSIRRFAIDVGVTDRAVSKWEAGAGDFVPRPGSQDMLDKALARAPKEARARFEAALGVPPGAAAQPRQPPSRGDVPRGRDGDGRPLQVTHPADGKEMVLVDAGPFPAGADNAPAWLPAFYIDMHPVTNGDYAGFAAAAGHPVPAHWTGPKPPEGLAAHPVVNVTHRDAEAYAAWAGKRLPSALEWEKAARGPDGNVFPWGDQETPAKCNVRPSGARATTPVDRYHSGVSHYGAYDMAGNVWEWCATQTEPGRFVLKGSAFTSPLAMAAGAAMNDASEAMLDDDTGFRCVSSPESLGALAGLQRLAGDARVPELEAAYDRRAVQQRHAVDRPYGPHADVGVGDERGPRPGHLGQGDHAVGAGHPARGGDVPHEAQGHAGERLGGRPDDLRAVKEPDVPGWSLADVRLAVGEQGVVISPPLGGSAERERAKQADVLHGRHVADVGGRLQPQRRELASGRIP
jgi:formylglycine-generating enzyme required for sulfatase activity